MKLRFLVLFGAVLFASVVVGCGKRVPEVDLDAPPRVVLISPARELPEIREAVINALQERTWVSEQEVQNVITARLNHKGAAVRATFTMSPDQVAIRLIEAEGKGAEKYVANVENSIRANLKRPAPPPPVAAPVAPPPPAPMPVGPVPPPTVAIFGRAQTPAEARTVLQKSLAQHSWVIEQLLDDGVLARLSHRKTIVHIKIIAHANDASIEYVSSEDLALDKTGHSVEYERWVRLLVDAIRANSN